MTTEEMLGRLEIEIEKDAGKMFRWRQIHRVVACVVTLTLIALPVLATMKDLEGLEHYFLFALTIIAAYEGLFRPAVHSARRGGDAADMTDLLWEFRSALIATPATDAAQRLAVHDKFRQRYQALFRARGQYLVDFSLAQHENEMATIGNARPTGQAQRDAGEPGEAGAAKPNAVRPIGLIAPPDGAAHANELRLVEPAAPQDSATNANERRVIEPAVPVEGAARHA